MWGPVRFDEKGWQHLSGTIFDSVGLRQSPLKSRDSRYHLPVWFVRAILFQGTKAKEGSVTNQTRGSRGVDIGAHGVLQGLDSVVKNVERALELLSRETTDLRWNREAEAGDNGYGGGDAPRSGQDVDSADEDLDAGMEARRVSRVSFTEESKVDRYNELGASESEVGSEGESPQTPGGVGRGVEGIVGQVVVDNEQGGVVQGNGQGEVSSREASLGGGLPKPGEGRNGRGGVVEGPVPNTRQAAGVARETSMVSQWKSPRETVHADDVRLGLLGQGDSTESLGLDLDRVVIDSKGPAGHQTDGSNPAQRQARYVLARMVLVGMALPPVCHIPPYISPTFRSRG